MTASLPDFVYARLDQTLARFSIPEWYCTDSARGEGWGSRDDCPICGHYMFDGTEVVTEEAFYEHLDNAHDRERVDRMCFVMRQVVDRFMAICESDQGTATWATEYLLHYQAVKDLAWIWNDHADYDSVRWA